MKKTELRKAQKAITTIAETENISAEEVRREMKAAIAEGLSGSDPAVQEMWRSMPCKGDVPEPEEVIAWLAEEVKRKMRI